MNTHELIESAALDALGLLDADEREAFEAAFRAAPPAVQAQVRREQLRVARAEALLPAGEPPLGLRARVLAAVREAMQNVTARKSDTPAFRRAAGVSSLWRIGAVGSMAAAVVFGFVAMQIRNDNRQMQESLASASWSDMFRKEFGNRFEQQLFDPYIRKVGFVSSNAGPSGRQGGVTLMLDDSRKRGYLYCKDLPSGDIQYEVVVVDKSGKSVKALLTFNAAPTGIKSETIEGLSIDSSETLAIRRVGSNEPVMTSRGL